MIIPVSQVSHSYHPQACCCLLLLRSTHSLQIRGLEHVSALSLVGTLGMLTALAVACVKLLLMSSKEPGPGHPEPHRAGSMVMLVALCDIIFACECLAAMLCRAPEPGNVCSGQDCARAADQSCVRCCTLHGRKAGMAVCPCLHSVWTPLPNGPVVTGVSAVQMAATR